MVAYKILDNVNIYYNGIDEIRIKKGIWNYEEAVLSLHDLTSELREILVKIFSNLNDMEFVDITEIINENDTISEDEKESIKNIFLSLKDQRYLQTESESELTKYLYEVLHGSMQSRFLQEEYFIKPLLFFSDNREVEKYAENYFGTLNVPYKIMTKEEYYKIISLDLTSKYDGLEQAKNIDEISKFLSQFSCVIGGMQNPNFSFIRNLNQGLIENNLSLSLAMIDGPFASVFTIHPPETGCFECLEQRILARMRDSTSFEAFTKFEKSKNRKVENSYLTPLLNSVVSLALMDGITISTISKSKLVGRVVNIFLPVLEIQVEDVLRIPYCSSCGTSSRAIMEEMYTSSSEIVNSLIEKVDIIEGD